MLRCKAQTAGAKVINERVRSVERQGPKGWRVNGRKADIVVGAGGINDPLARHRGCALPTAARAHSVGWYIPGFFEPRIVCRFFKHAHGYAWWFPRSDHASLSIELGSGPFDKKLALRRLRRFATEDLVDIDIRMGRSFSWAIPLQSPAVFARRCYSGADWLLAGDAGAILRESIAGIVMPLRKKASVSL